MKTFKARGVVLREVSVGEADKIAVLLLKGRGKLGVSAKGARRSGSKFLAATQLFTYSDFVITQGANFFALAQTDVIESFYGLCTSVEQLSAASLLAKLCDRVILEQEPCDDILRLLIYGFNALCKAKPPELVTAAFSLKFLEYSGLAPSFDVCSVCQKRLTGADAGKRGLYPAGLHGIICADCVRTAGNPQFWLPENTRRAGEYVIAARAGGVFSFEASPQVLAQLESYADYLLESHFDTNIPIFSPR